MRRILFPIVLLALTGLAHAGEPARYGAPLPATAAIPVAAAVAAFAQQLGDAKYTGDFSLADSARLARGAKGEDPFGLRGEFVQLVELAQSLQTPQNVQVRAD